MLPPEITSFFDEGTNTATHIAQCSETRKCAIIDSVLDFDASSGRTNTHSADMIIDHVRAHDLTVEWIIETHIHADHLSAAHYLKEKLGGKSAIGAHVDKVEKAFAPVFIGDRHQFDHLFDDGEEYKVGNIQAKAIHTPGHTPACMSHLIGDACFVGDTLFMPDFGTARCDFPGGNPGELYQSIQKLFALPDTTRLFLCHDYKAPGREEFCWETTIGAQKASNLHVKSGTDEDRFVEMRTTRDAALSMPALIIPSVQVNMRGGDLPPADQNGIRYIKIPLNTL